MDEQLSRDIANSLSVDLQDEVSWVVHIRIRSLFFVSAIIILSTMLFIFR